MNVEVGSDLDNYLGARSVRSHHGYAAIAAQEHSIIPAYSGLSSLYEGDPTAGRDRANATAL